VQVNLLIFAVIVVMAVSLAATLWVGFSRENRDGDPEYERKTGSKLTRLILLYVLTVAVVVVAFMVLLGR
jgi:hypothetical protein